jgi:branched-chain amino acid transport system permease protein
LATELIFILQQVANGLLLGFYYLLIALGLSIIFSLGGIVNLAHGAFYAVGAYLIVFLNDKLGYGFAFVASPILVAILGMVIERLFLRRFYRSDPVLSLLFTFALSMVIEQSLRMIFGASPLSFSIPEFARGQLIVGDFFYPVYRLGMLLVAIAAVAGTWVLLNKTAFGKIVRAGINDPDMVRAMGISLAPGLGRTRPS